MSTKSMSAYPQMTTGTCRHTGLPYRANLPRGHVDKIESLLDGFAGHVLPGHRDVAPVRFYWRSNSVFELCLMRGVIHLRWLAQDEL